MTDPEICWLRLFSADRQSASTAVFYIVSLQNPADHQSSRSSVFYIVSLQALVDRQTAIIGGPSDGNHWWIVSRHLRSHVGPVLDNGWAHRGAPC